MPILDPVTPSPHLHAFTGYGIELEYMIVAADGMDVLPVADVVLRDDEGTPVNEVDRGGLAWSNELVAHVIELKTNGPAKTLAGLHRLFHRDLLRIGEQLASRNAVLLPTAMHPLFDPERETVLWPHGQNEIYTAYDRIFSCRGHGWSNLQSMHINLPFFNDEEFTRLHAAIRAVIPIIPALSASSPFVEGRATGWLDSRLDVYRRNQARIPEIAGMIVPEPVAGIDDYHHRILDPVYRAIAPHDPDGILADDWLNSRGAIARFQRQTIEIRVIDLQECPAADLAVAQAVTGLVRALYDGRLGDLETFQQLPTDALAGLLFACARTGPDAAIDHRATARAFDLEPGTSVGELWRRLLDRDLGIENDPAVSDALEMLLDHGPLAARLLATIGPEPAAADLRALYHDLGECLKENEPFRS